MSVPCSSTYFPCPFIYPSTSLSIYQITHQSVRPSTHPSVHPPVHPPIRLAFYPSGHPSNSLFNYTSPIRLPTQPPIYPFTYLSISLPITQTSSLVSICSSCFNTNYMLGPAVGTRILGLKSLPLTGLYSSGEGRQKSKQIIPIQHEKSFNKRIC